ncbi:MAG: hypothetical protein HQL31_13655, partial [Planctomycetes bacterium]|nr:hypothetical protein [Planctomycetota bacterium]
MSGDPLPRLLILVLLLCGGCFGRESSQTPEVDLRTALRSRLDGQPEKGADRYRLCAELALLHMKSGEYGAAETWFTKAHLLDQDLYTRSLAELALSKIFNEKVKTFRAHCVERWMVRLLAVMNSLVADRREEALTHLRQLSSELRLDADPYDEVRDPSTRTEYLALAGALFYRCGDTDHGFADMLKAWEINSGHFPTWLAGDFLNLANSRGLPGLAPSDNRPAPSAFFQKHLKAIELVGHGPQKQAVELSISMFEYWPIIHAMTGGDPQAKEIENAYLGMIGERLLKISYPVYTVIDAGGSRERGQPGMDLNEQMTRSWDLQKKRMVA